MTSGPTDISMIVCTHTEERWQDLNAALESLWKQTVAPREIIVVIDHSEALLHRAQRLLHSEIVVENHLERGLSGARNSGAARATCELIGFLDDDAIALPDYLGHLLACFQEHVLGAGGASLPMWLGSPPAWFPAEFHWVIGCSYLGMPQSAGSVRNVFGGCMLIRRDVLASVGGFRTDLGHVGSRALGCEETDLCIRARERWPRGVFMYVPQARILHKVPPNRACWSYFRKRCFAEGLSKAYITRRLGSDRGLATERAHLVKTLPRGLARGVGDSLLRGDPAGIVRSAMIAAGTALTAAGYLWGRIVPHDDIRRPRGQEERSLCRQNGFLG